MRPPHQQAWVRLQLKPKPITKSLGLSSNLCPRHHHHQSLGLGSNLSPSSRPTWASPRHPFLTSPWAGCFNLSPNQFSSWQSPRHHLLHGLPLRLDILFRGRLPTPAVPWRDGQWRQSRGIQEMLPPWRLEREEVMGKMGEGGSHAWNVGW